MEIQFLNADNERLRIELNRELNRNTDLEREVRELKDELGAMTALNRLLKKRINILKKNMVL